MPSLSPYPEGNNGWEANRFEEERQHEHGDAYVLSLRYRRAAKDDDGCQIEEEDVSWADEAHKEGP